MGSAAKQSGIDGGKSVASLVGRVEAATSRAATGVAVIAPAFAEALVTMGVEPTAVTLLPNYTHISETNLSRARRAQHSAGARTSSSFSTRETWD